MHNRAIQQFRLKPALLAIRMLLQLLIRPKIPLDRSLVPRHAPPRTNLQNPPISLLPKPLAPRIPLRHRTQQAVNKANPAHAQQARLLRILGGGDTEGY